MLDWIVVVNVTIPRLSLHSIKLDSIKEKWISLIEIGNLLNVPGISSKVLVWVSPVFTFQQDRMLLLGSIARVVRFK